MWRSRSASLRAGNLIEGQSSARGILDVRLAASNLSGLASGSNLRNKSALGAISTSRGHSTSSSSDLDSLTKLLQWSPAKEPTPKPAAKDVLKRPSADALVSGAEVSETSRTSHSSTGDLVDDAGLLRDIASVAASNASSSSFLSETAATSLPKVKTRNAALKRATKPKKSMMSAKPVQEGSAPKEVFSMPTLLADLSKERPTTNGTSAVESEHVTSVKKAKKLDVAKKLKFGRSEHATSDGAAQIDEAGLEASSSSEVALGGGLLHSFESVSVASEASSEASSSLDGKPARSSAGVVEGSWKPPTTKHPWAPTSIFDFADALPPKKAKAEGKKVGVEASSETNAFPGASPVAEDDRLGDLGPQRYEDITDAPLDVPGVVPTPIEPPELNVPTLAPEDWKAKAMQLSKSSEHSPTKEHSKQGGAPESAAAEAKPVERSAADLSNGTTDSDFDFWRAVVRGNVAPDESASKSKDGADASTGPSSPKGTEVKPKAKDAGDAAAVPKPTGPPETGVAFKPRAGALDSKLKKETKLSELYTPEESQANRIKFDALLASRPSMEWLATIGVPKDCVPEVQSVKLRPKPSPYSPTLSPLFAAHLSRVSGYWPHHTPVFIDADVRRANTRAVARSGVYVLIYDHLVMRCAQTLLELHTAIQHDVPVLRISPVAVNAQDDVAAILHQPTVISELLDSRQAGSFGWLQAQLGPKVDALEVVKKVALKMKRPVEGWDPLAHCQVSSPTGVNPHELMKAINAVHKILLKKTEP